MITDGFKIVGGGADRNNVDDLVWMFDQKKLYWKTFQKRLIKPRAEFAAIVVEYSKFKQFCM